jgi:hypothetical protein
LHPSEEVAMPGKYEGVHSFLFLHAKDSPPPADVIAELRKQVNKDEGPVFFASLFEGDFAGFAHLSAVDLPELAGFIDSVLFDLGVRSDNSTEAKVYTTAAAIPMGPKRQSPRFCGLCRVRTTERPLGVLQAIGDSFGSELPFVGASMVIGRFPLLVELGSDDMDELTEAIERLRGVPGVDEDMHVGTADTGSEGAK